MEEEYSVTDPTELLEAASEFAQDPGNQLSLIKISIRPLLT